MSKKRVAILRGGMSSEFSVSMRTGAALLEHIDRGRYLPLDVIVTKNGSWLYEGRERKPEHLLSTVDVVCNALHGTYGEDGTIQRFLDRHGIPYTGSKALASSIAMNKVLTKECLAAHNITMSPHVRVSRDRIRDLGTIIDSIHSMFGPEYVVKPINAGSSHGTYMVKSPKELHQALHDALSLYDEVMVEKRIRGREATCGVIENYRDQRHYALPPIEIIVQPGVDFFNQDVKYNGSTLELCPSQFSPIVKKKIMDVTISVHQILGLSQYSRSDFMIADTDVYFLEVNTLPGLTTESLLPKAIHAVGGTYRDFITHLLEGASISTC